MEGPLPGVPGGELMLREPLAKGPVPLSGTAGRNEPQRTQRTRSEARRDARCHNAAGRRGTTPGTLPTPNYRHYPWRPGRLFPSSRSLRDAEGLFEPSLCALCGFNVVRTVLKEGPARQRGCREFS